MAVRHEVVMNVSAQVSVWTFSYSECLSPGSCGEHLFNSLRNHQPSAPPVARAESTNLATRSPVLELSLRGVLSGPAFGRLAPVPQQHRSDSSDHVCSS